MMMPGTSENSSITNKTVSRIAPGPATNQALLLPAGTKEAI